MTKSKRNPIRRGARRKLSPTAKFITDEEQAAIGAWLKTNEVEVLEPVDPTAAPTDDEGAPEEEVEEEEE
ncbi:hypothetical protein [Roseivivax sp. CAU 1761]